MRRALLALLASLVALPAAAQTASPEAATGALRNALQDVCFPFVADGRAVSDTPGGGRLTSVRAEGARTIYRASDGTRLIVDVTQDAQRTCTIAAFDGRPSLLRSEVMSIIAARAEAFVPFRQPMPTGNYAARDTWCGLRNGQEYAALASTSTDDDTDGGPAMMVTIMRLAERDDRCSDPRPS